MNTVRAVAALIGFILVGLAILQLLETVDATPAGAIPERPIRRLPPWVHPDVAAVAEFESQMRALEAAAARAAEVQAAETARIETERQAAEQAERERAAVTPPNPVAVPPRPAPSPNAGAGPVGGDEIWAHLARIRQCESGGNYSAVSSNGQYRGAYQFSYSTWAAMGGTGDPAAASPAEQDARAYALYQRVGSSAWPVCQYR